VVNQRLLKLCYMLSFTIKQQLQLTASAAAATEDDELFLSIKQLLQILHWLTLG